MNHCLEQLFLAARKNDEGWPQVLFFVILAIFYVVGGIIKAKANKTAPEGKKQTPFKPVRKPPEIAIDLQMLKQIWRSGKPVAKPQVQPAGRKVAHPATARSASYAAVVTNPRPAGMAIPQVQPKLEKVAAGIAVPAEIPQTKYLSEILSDYENPESLRRAILHYEILGKPLSLRDSSERIY